MSNVIQLRNTRAEPKQKSRLFLTDTILPRLKIGKYTDTGCEGLRLKSTKAAGACSSPAIGPLPAPKASVSANTLWGFGPMILGPHPI